MSRANPRFHRINPLPAPVNPTFGVVRYFIQGLHSGQMTINIFDYINSVPAPTQTELTTLLGNISAGVFPAYVAVLSNEWSCVREGLLVVHRNDIQGVFSATNVGILGGTVSAALDTEMAVVGIKYTLIKGQHGRGRISLPAVPSSAVTGSRVTSIPFGTDLIVLGTSMTLARSDGVSNWIPCVSVRSATPPHLAAFASGITRIAWTPLLGTIRRRKIGRGK